MKLKGERERECQVYVFPLLVEVGFLPFMNMVFLSLTSYLIAAEFRISTKVFQLLAEVWFFPFMNMDSLSLT